MTPNQSSTQLTENYATLVKCVSVVEFCSAFWWVANRKTEQNTQAYTQPSATSYQLNFY